MNAIPQMRQPAAKDCRHYARAVLLIVVALWLPSAAADARIAGAASSSSASWALPNPNLDLRAVGPVRMSAATPDGGAIVGGDFDFLGGDSVVRQGLAKIRPDGGVDATWNVSIENLRDIAVADGWLYVVGYFSQVNGQPRNGIARLSVATGQLDSWRTDVAEFERFGLVAIALSGGDVFVGGGFSSIAGVPRSNLVKFRQTGQLDADWVATTNGPVVALTIEGSNLFLAGNFSTVNGQQRSRAAKLSTLGAGELDAAWAPAFGTASRRIVDVAFDGGFFYAAGCFTEANGADRSFVARVASTGIGVLDTVWAPALLIRPSEV